MHGERDILGITTHFNSQSDFRNQVAGHFLIEEGRIKVWKDWPIPGIKQIVGGQS
jgi:hypothetical protein